MSDMDGVSEVKDIVKRAKKWGMPAIAVTDHGCVQSFPDANDVYKRQVYGACHILRSNISAMSKFRR